MRLLPLLLLPSVLLASEPGRPDPAEFGQRVLAEINAARANPRAYAMYLKEWLDHFDDKLLRLPHETALITREGSAAVEEAIDFLESARPLPHMTWSEGLHLAAQEHVQEQAGGATGHAGSKGSSPFQRMERYGRWKSTAGEAIGYGPTDPRRVVLNLIVDDGVANRGHRKLLFSPDFHVAGAAFGPHAGFGHVCVIDFAGGFEERRPSR